MGNVIGLLSTNYTGEHYGKLIEDRPVASIITKALDNGLIIINAGEKILRFLPPLVITEKDVDDMIAILETCLV